jgi:UTP--glucose-1-phosphate uridylyltransferase
MKKSHPEKIKKAIVLAAGKGTRLAPATSVLPKEMFPVIDTPVIHHVLEEVIDGGVEEIIIVLSRGKEMIRSYIERSMTHLTQGVQIRYVYQSPHQYGNGAGLFAARKFIKEEPFIVAFGDSFASRKAGRFAHMNKLYGSVQMPVISLMAVEKKFAHIYGMAVIATRSKTSMSLDRLWEKPGNKMKPPYFAAPNGYILDQHIFEYLENGELDARGELQLTDAINRYTKLSGQVFKAPFFECGNREDYVQAVMQMAKIRSSKPRR